jgi:hypothetical protein
MIFFNLSFKSNLLQSISFLFTHSIMKIIHHAMSKKSETHEEEHAARKLLEVLRNARLREKELEENEAKTSEFRSDLLPSTELYDSSIFYDNAENISIYEISTLNDKKMLRDSLEKMINIYLTKLREDSIEYNLDDNHFRERREIINKVNRRKNLVPGSCKTMKRRIGTFDRLEIEQATRVYESNEFNIRKSLNYRSVMRSF